MRFEVPADHAGIHAVHAASFPTPHEADLVDALRQAGRLTISLVATAGSDSRPRMRGLRPGAIPAAGGLVRYAPELG